MSSPSQSAEPFPGIAREPRVTARSRRRNTIPAEPAETPVILRKRPPRASGKAAKPVGATEESPSPRAEASPGHRPGTPRGREIRTPDVKILRSAPCSPANREPCAAPPSERQVRRIRYDPPAEPAEKPVILRKRPPQTRGKPRSRLARPKNLPPLARNPHPGIAREPRVTARSRRPTCRFFGRRHTLGQTDSPARRLPQNDRFVKFCAILILTRRASPGNPAWPRDHAARRADSSVGAMLSGERRARRGASLRMTGSSGLT